MAVLKVVLLAFGAAIAALGLIALVYTPFSHPDGDVPGSMGYWVGLSLLALGVGLCFVGAAIRRPAQR
jgi:dipeptide/tripeptide permease